MAIKTIYIISVFIMMIISILTNLLYLRKKANLLKPALLFSGNSIIQIILFFTLNNHFAIVKLIQVITLVYTITNWIIILFVLKESFLKRTFVFLINQYNAYAFSGVFLITYYFTNHLLLAFISLFVTLGLYLLVYVQHFLKLYFRFAEEIFMYTYSLFLFVFTIFDMCVYYITLFDPNLYFYLFFLFMVIITVISNIVIFCTIKQAIAFDEYRMYKIAMAKAQELYLKDKKKIEEEMERIKSLRHDLRHHAIVLNYFLENNKNGDAKKYLEKMTSQQDENNYKVYCNDSIINTVVSYYVSRATSNGLNFQPVIEVPYKMDFDDLDLTSLLSNLLENSFEEMEKNNSKDQIDFLIRAKGSFLLIITRNKCLKKPKFCDGIPVSTKKDSSNLGSKTIRMIAEKYKGMLSYDYTKKSLTVRVIINEKKIDVIKR